MTDIQMAQFLQKYYKHYTLNWYLDNTKRLHALFEREYLNWRELQIAHINAKAQTNININVEIMKQVYNDYFDANYDSDFKDDKFNTMRKAQTIRHLWVKLLN